MHIRLSKDENKESFFDAARALWQLDVDFFPVQGTLIGLLRYGSLQGELSKGKVDVVDRDMDFMVRVSGPKHWLQIVAKLTRALVDRGWNSCWLHQVGDLHIWAGQWNMLKCMVVQPFFHIADFAPYVIGQDGILRSWQFCQNGTAETLWPPAAPHRTRGLRKQAFALLHRQRRIKEDAPHRLKQASDTSCMDLSPKELWNGALPRSVIYPLGRCRAYHDYVPCPRQSVRYLHGMHEYGDCLAYPAITGSRNPFDERNTRLAKEPLDDEDIAILRDTSARLQAAGFQSFEGHFHKCKDPKVLVHDTQKWSAIV